MKKTNLKTPPSFLMAAKFAKIMPLEKGDSFGDMTIFGIYN